MEDSSGKTRARTSLTIPTDLRTIDDVVLTKKYVFIPSGNKAYPLFARPDDAVGEAQLLVVTHGASGCSRKVFVVGKLGTHTCNQDYNDKVPPDAVIVVYAETMTAGGAPESAVVDASYLLSYHTK